MATEQPSNPWVVITLAGEVKVMPGDEGLGAEVNSRHQGSMDGHLNTPIDPAKGLSTSDSLTPPPLLLLGTEEPFCRICHEGPGGGSGELLSPCECCGSLAVVHRRCLECWLAASNSSQCELCRHAFNLERLPRPLTEWLCSPSMQHQRRTLCGDALCFLLITPLASLSGWLCVQGALDLYQTNGMEALGLLLLTLALFTIYLFWTMVSMRYHLHMFQTWRHTDQKVRLQVPLPTKGTNRGNKALNPSFLSKTTTNETGVGDPASQTHAPSQTSCY